LVFWNTADEWRADWIIESPPQGTLGEIPLNFLQQEGVSSMQYLTCIANDCRQGNRQYQDIRLSDLGISDAIMDYLQPKIVVREWYFYFHYRQFIN